MTAPVSRTGAEVLHAAINATGCRACGALDHPSGCAADVAGYTRTGATDRPCTCPEDEAGRMATYTCGRDREPHAVGCPRWGTHLGDREVEAKPLPTEEDVAATMLAIGWGLATEFHHLSPVIQEHVLRMAQLIANARAAAAPLARVQQIEAWDAGYAAAQCDADEQPYSDMPEAATWKPRQNPYLAALLAEQPGGGR